MEPNDRTPLESLPEGSWVMLDESARYSPTRHLFFPNSNPNDTNFNDTSSLTSSSSSTYNFNTDSQTRFQPGGSGTRQHFQSLALTPGLALFPETSIGMTRNGDRGLELGLGFDTTAGNSMKGVQQTYSFKSVGSNTNVNNDGVNVGIGEKGLRMQEAERSFNNFNNINFNINLNADAEGGGFGAGTGLEKPARSSSTGTLTPSVGSNAVDDELSVFDQLYNFNNTNNPNNNNNTMKEITRAGTPPPVRLYNGRTPPVLGARATPNLNQHLTSFTSAPAIIASSSNSKSSSFQYEKNGQSLDDLTVSLETYKQLKEQDRVRQIAKKEKEKNKKSKSPNRKIRKRLSGGNVVDGNRNLFGFGEEYGINWMLDQIYRFVSLAVECPVPLTLLMMISYYMGTRARK